MCAVLSVCVYSDSVSVLCVCVCVQTSQVAVWSWRPVCGPSLTLSLVPRPSLDLCVWGYQDGLTYRAHGDLFPVGMQPSHCQPPVVLSVWHALFSVA